VATVFLRAAHKTLSILRRTLTCAGVTLIGATHAFAEPLAGPVTRASLVQGDSPELQPDRDLPPFIPRAGRAAALANPGFEDTENGFEPTAWIQFRRGIWERSPSLAHSGDYSVRSSPLFGWFQNWDSPASPHMNVTIGGFAAVEFGGEQASFVLQQFDSGGGFLAAKRGTSPLGLVPGEHTEFWTAHRLVPGTVSLQLFIGGRASNSWVRFDDLKVFREKFHEEGDLVGEDWTFEGGASRLDGMITLPAGSSITQRVAAGQSRELYFIAGDASTASDAELEFVETWLQRDENDPTGEAQQSQEFSAGTTPFLIQFGGSDGVASGLASSAVSNTSDTEVELTDLSRGFIRLEPPVWERGPASPDSDMVLVAAWPGNLSSASIEIIATEGGSVGTLTPTIEGHTASLRWDGDDLPAGSYRAVFHLQDSEGRMIAPETKFSILDAGPEPTRPSAFDGGPFPRVAWVWYIASEDDEAIREGIRAAKEDGFNLGVLHVRPDQMNAAAAIVAEEEFPVFVYTPDFAAIFNDFIAREYFSGSEYTDRLRPLLGDFVGSPWFLGVYAIDEPFGTASYEQLRRCHLAIERAGDLGQSTATLATNVAPEELPTIDSPVFAVDFYPFDVLNPLADREQVLSNIVSMNEYITTARGLERDTWILPQGFESSEGNPYRGVPNSLHRAQLNSALVAGAKGIFVFTHSAITTIEGLRGPQNEPTRKLPPFVEFNTMTARLSGLLSTLSVPTLDDRATAPFALSTASTPDDTRYALVLNADPWADRTLTLTLDQTSFDTIRDHVAEADLPVVENTVSVALAPGGLAILELGESTLTDITPDPAPADPVMTTIPLRVTHEFVVEAPGKVPLQVVGLDMAPDGRSVAASHSAWFRPTTPLVYRLGTDGSVTAEGGAERWPSESWSFLPLGEVAATSFYLGAEIFGAEAVGGAPVATYLGRSGGVLALDAGEGDDFWAAAFQYGTRRLERSGDQLTIAATGLAQAQVHDDVIGGLFGGGAVVLLRDTSINRVLPNLESEDEHTTKSLSRAGNKFTANSFSKVAVPAHQRGAYLVQLAADGTPGDPTLFAEDAYDVTAAAWVTDRILALADGAYGVRFYRISAEGSAKLLGMWSPSEDLTEKFYIWSLAGAAGRLAVGFSDGRVMVLDAGVVSAIGHAETGWVLH